MLFPQIFLVTICSSSTFKWQIVKKTGVSLKFSTKPLVCCKLVGTFSSLKLEDPKQEVKKNTEEEEQNK